MRPRRTGWAWSAGCTSRTICCPPRSRWPPPSRSERPIAAQSAKANLLAARNMGLAQAIQYEREMQAICLATRDAAEGRQAFAQKRPGRFTGR